MKVVLKLTIFFILIVTVFQNSYANTASGYIKARVLEDVSLINMEDKNVVRLNEVKDQKPFEMNLNGGKIYQGNMTYNFRSEPNSLISVQYKSVSDDYIIYESNLIPTNNPKPHNALLIFDQQGNAKLGISPMFFVNSSNQDLRYKTVHHVTLFNN